jgi:hypothetical protein
MSAAEVVLAVIGTAALVMAIVLLTSHKAAAAAPQERVIVREKRPDMWRWGYGMGPYYSHLPVRPLMLG